MSIEITKKETFSAEWPSHPAFDGNAFRHQLRFPSGYVRGGDAEGKPYPSMDMLYGSKTGIQGEADLIIMLGRKDNSSTRYISLPKNKLQTPRNRAKRNGRWTVTLNADIARIE